MTHCCKRAIEITCFSGQPMAIYNVTTALSLLGCWLFVCTAPPTLSWMDMYKLCLDYQFNCCLISYSSTSVLNNFALQLYHPLLCWIEVFSPGHSAIWNKFSEFISGFKIQRCSTKGLVLQDNLQSQSKMQYDEQISKFVLILRCNMNLSLVSQVFLTRIVATM